MASSQTPSDKAFVLATHFLQRPSKDGSNAKNIAWQMDHRLQLVSFWDIKPGSRVLEIGCGQGDCTIVLADAVGEKGHVDAVDPGAPDYGAPYTLSQSQEHIKTTPLGPRITFHSTDPISYLSSLPASSPPYDYVVLTHCIWYFESPSILTHVVSALASKAKSLCIAEWSLRASKPTSEPHVLTALLLASLEAKRKIPSDGNIRTILSPPQITSNVTSTRLFELNSQQTEQTNEGLLDAYWEVSDTLRRRENVLGGLKDEGVPEKELAALAAAYDALKASVEILPRGEEKAVRSMDVWVAKFAAV